MAGYADLPAHRQDGTGGTLRQPSRADVFAEGHQERVDLDPVAFRQARLEGGHGFLRRGRRHVAPAVGDAVNVDVHADGRMAAGDADREVSTFRADTVKGHEHLRVAW